MAGAASTATVSVLAYRLHLIDRKARRWAVARVHGMAADIGVRSRAWDGGIQLQRNSILLMSALLRNAPTKWRFSHQHMSHHAHP